MPKLRNLNPQKLVKILERKGYILDRSKGSHRIYYHPVTKRRVVVPFHKKDLPKGTLLQILRDAGIDREELEKFF